MWNRFNRSEHCEREKFREHKLHMSKLRDTKPRIDNKPEPKYLEMKQNHKKAPKNEFRNEDIQRSNEILLKKLIEIDSKAIVNTPSEKGKSVGKNSKTKMITNQNYGMWKRINSVKSHYSVNEFKRNYKYNQYLAFILSQNSRRVPKNTDFRDSNGLQTLNTRPTVRRIYNQFQKTKSYSQNKLN